MVYFCPTHNMIGEFFMKPLQGTLFKCMRDKILNLPVSINTAMHRSVLDIQKNKGKKHEQKEADAVIRRIGVTKEDGNLPELQGNGIKTTSLKEKTMEHNSDHSTGK